MVNQILEQLVNEVNTWKGVRGSFERQPYNSAIRQNLGARLYQNPAQFVGIADDVVHNQIANQEVQADTAWINYANTNLDAVLTEYNENELFSMSLDFNQEYTKLLDARGNRNAVKNILMEKYQSALTSYASADINFLDRLYESAVNVETQVHRKNMSKNRDVTKGLDKDTEKAYITAGVRTLPQNEKNEAYVKWALIYANRED